VLSLSEQGERSLFITEFIIVGKMPAPSIFIVSWCNWVQLKAEYGDVAFPVHRLSSEALRYSQGLTQMAVTQPGANSNAS
jgi:hypothetical protein